MASCSAFKSIKKINIFKKGNMIFELILLALVKPSGLIKIFVKIWSLSIKLAVVTNGRGRYPAEATRRARVFCHSTKLRKLNWLG